MPHEVGPNHPYPHTTHVGCSRTHLFTRQSQRNAGSALKVARGLQQRLQPLEATPGDAEDLVRDRLRLAEGARATRQYDANATSLAVSTVRRD